MGPWWTQLYILLPTLENNKNKFNGIMSSVQLLELNLVFTLEIWIEIIDCCIHYFVSWMVKRDYIMWL